MTIKHELHFAQKESSMGAIHKVGAGTPRSDCGEARRNALKQHVKVSKLSAMPLFLPQYNVKCSNHNCRIGNSFPHV